MGGAVDIFCGHIEPLDDGDDRSGDNPAESLERQGTPTGRRGEGKTFLLKYVYKRRFLFA